MGVAQLGLWLKGLESQNLGGDLLGATVTSNRGLGDVRLIIKSFMPF